MRIQRSDRIGIVGPNGSGKTTLIGLLTGTLEPDDGTLKLGANLEIANLDQHRDSLDPNTTVAAALTRGGGDTVMVNGKPKHVVGYMKDFLFAPEQARTPLSKLSGGERGRLMLAQALAKQSNLLVLDEPTNDLDMETLDVLEEMLADYAGTVLLISHDRDFLDRLVAASSCRRATAAGPNMPAAIPTCWRSVARISHARSAWPSRTRQPRRLQSPPRPLTPSAR